MVLGTNAMTEYGIQTVKANGTVVEPFSPTKGREGASEYGVRRVYLEQTVHLAPGAAQQVRVTVEQDSLMQQPCESEIGVIVPTEEVLADKFCDFQERGDRTYTGDEQLRNRAPYSCKRLTGW